MLKFVLSCNIVVLSLLLVVITVGFARFLKTEILKAKDGKSKFFLKE